MNALPQTPPVCPYCGERAVLVDGGRVYPHRPDLKHLSFWLCAPCDAYVGCHPPTQKFTQNRTDIPLGRLANAELRTAKSAVHQVLDPLWKSKQHSRSYVYARLAGLLGLPVEHTHIGMFDIRLCKEAYALCSDSRLWVRNPSNNQPKD